MFTLMTDRTQAPKKSLSETRLWLRRWIKATDPAIHNYAIMLRVESTLNPTNPNDEFWSTTTSRSFSEEEEEVTPSSSTKTAARINKSASPQQTPRPYLIGTVGIHKPGSTCTSTSTSTNPVPPTTNSPPSLLPENETTTTTKTITTLLEMSYMLHHTHWHRGLATRAVRLFLAHYWTALSPPPSPPIPTPNKNGTDALEAQIDAANLASAAVARKGGFEPTGEMVGETEGEEGGKEGFVLGREPGVVRRMGVWRVRRPGTTTLGERGVGD